ncbi:MAG: flagellar assembly protein FliX [Pseudomonadota bacterium]
MRIDGLSLVTTRALLNALPKVLPERFGLGERAPLPAPATTQQQQGVAAPSVQMLVALAAADPTVERRRRMAVDAERGLDALDRLHAELLSGTAGPERLQDIAEWAKSIDSPEDPVLADIMRDIDLRVRVELAKFNIEV